MERYTGPMKMNPPPLLWYVGLAHHSLMYVHGSLERAQIVDTQWLNSLLHDSNPIEWGGYNADLDVWSSDRRTTLPP